MYAAKVEQGRVTQVIVGKIKEDPHYTSSSSFATIYTVAFL